MWLLFDYKIPTLKWPEAVFYLPSHGNVFAESWSNFQVKNDLWKTTVKTECPALLWWIIMVNVSPERHGMSGPVIKINKNLCFCMLSCLTIEHFVAGVSVTSVNRNSRQSPRRGKMQQKRENMTLVCFSTCANWVCLLIVWKKRFDGSRNWHLIWLHCDGAKSWRYTNSPTFVHYDFILIWIRLWLWFFFWMGSLMKVMDLFSKIKQAHACENPPPPNTLFTV